MRTKSRSLVALAGAAVGTIALALGAVAATPLGAGAQTPNPFQRGPAPTRASIEAPTGPFSVSTVTVAAGNGFGGGTIYYPNDTSQGTFGAVAVSPGFLSPQFLIQWAGPRIASQGFVVFTIDTNTIFDPPSSRSAELTAALNYLVNSSPTAARSRVDRNRLAVMGHSMGGGGTLEAATAHPEYQAAVALQPWDIFASYANDRVPSMIIGAQNDTVASVGSFASPFYDQIPAASEKAFLNVAGVGHELGTSNNTTQSKYAIAWLKRYVDNDTRYEQFICPRPVDSALVEYRDTCPG
jgi:dienelactone hydrolase